MSRSALVIAAVVVVLTTVGSVAAMESDPLGVLAAGVYVFVALILLVVIYIGDAMIRSTRKARANDKSVDPT